jgi:hypothetical protein
MRAPYAVILRRLHVRGFRHMTMHQVSSIETWMRLNPAVNALLFALCGFTHSVSGLLILALFFAIGMLTSVHPFEWFYTEVIRSLEQSPEMPASPPLRRGVFGIGMAGSLMAAWCFTENFVGWGYLTTGVMAVSTAFLAFTHICIPSMIYRGLRFGLLRSRRILRPF